MQKWPFLNYPSPQIHFPHNETVILHHMSFLYYKRSMFKEEFWRKPVRISPDCKCFTLPYSCGVGLECAIHVYSTPAVEFMLIESGYAYEKFQGKPVISLISTVMGASGLR